MLEDSALLIRHVFGVIRSGWDSNLNRPEFRDKSPRAFSFSINLDRSFEQLQLVIVPWLVANLGFSTSSHSHLGAHHDNNTLSRRAIAEGIASFSLSPYR